MNNTITCPILVYYSFRQSSVEDNNATSILEFEYSIKSLLEQGYKPISLKDLYKTRRRKAIIDAKSLCIVFKGGYLDNYTFAFPIIKKYNIHVDIFVATQLMGLSEYPGIDNFTPHFSWDEAHTMFESGLVDIYAMWHPFDRGSDPKIEIPRKMKEIKERIPGSSPKTAFWMSNNQEVENIYNLFNDLEIPQNLIPILEASQESIANGFLPYEDVNPGYSALDVYESTLDIIDGLTTSNNKQINSIDSFNELHTVILPTADKPPIRNYLRHAVPLGVIAALRKDKADLIVLNDYINVVYRPWDNWFDYDNRFYMQWSTIDGFKITPELIAKHKINVGPFIIKNLDLGYYADINLDTYYIPHKWGYMQRHNTHCVLIYGYDSQLNAFLALSYTASSRFESFIIEYNQLIASCSGLYFKDINFIKSNKEVKVPYNLTALIDKLQTYISGDRCCIDYSNYLEYNNSQYYNREACKKFYESIKSLECSMGNIHKTSLYSFLEHKRCMSWRLEYIAKRVGLSDSYYEIQHNRVTERTENAMLIGIKYNLTKSKNSLSRITKIIDELNNEEVYSISKLINTLTK